MKCLVVMLLALGLMSGAAVPVVANPLSKTLKQSGISPEDFALMGKAEQSLVATNAPRAGQKASWSNPQSASTGTVAVEKVQQNCAIMQHQVTLTDKPAPVSLRVRLCRTADGAWRLAP